MPGLFESVQSQTRCAVSNHFGVSISLYSGDNFCHSEGLVILLIVDGTPMEECNRFYGHGFPYPCQNNRFDVL